MLPYNAQISGAALIASDCICLLGKMWNYFTVYLNFIFQENSIYFTKLIGTLFHPPRQTIVKPRIGLQLLHSIPHPCLNCRQ